MACKKWDANVLVIPAYLASGLEIGVSIPNRNSLDRGDDCEAEETGEVVGKFNAANTTEIWYIRPGVKLAFHIGGDLARKHMKQGDLAAVFIVGVLCSEEHNTEHESSDDDKLTAVIE